MSTNSSIAIENKDGSIIGIYCHWDGYVSGNGRILFNHYNTEEKVRELIMHGDLSSLYEEIYPNKNSKHDFNNKQKDVCVFYHRDRGEDWKDVCPKYYKNKKQFYETQLREYNYKFANGKWMYKSDGSWKNLKVESFQED